MANAAIAHENLADAGSLTATSEAFLLPVLNLQDPHIGRRWRSETGSESCILDLGAMTSIDTIRLSGLTGSVGETVRLRLSTVDTSGAAGDVLDTGILASGATAYFDIDYGTLCYLLAAPTSCRYVRIDLADVGADYVEAGRLFVGLREAFTYNFVPGATIGWVDRSKRQEARGGQTLIWNDNSYRQVEINLEWVTEAQRYGIVETLDRVNGQNTDVLLILDTDSDNLARDSIWGLVSDLTPVAFTNLIGIFTKQYRVKERL